ncbi:MgtC/SapB family protein [Cognatilysobacter tabacisoli]|uniref:MgtC/SapB family protein n=1 Tax=Cognatilysobacter tabacisoli TaxID=2315424 RepID=UPI000E6AE8D2|nr:MgtC/SapB family protein [Lysobacter tabacisoli]
MDWEPQLRVVLDVAFAMLLGGFVGFEREMKDRPAGFRTHMLVGGAAALLVGVGRLAMLESDFRDNATLQIDVLRLVEAVVAGVAFIGAGTIFATRGGQAVAGITTAASLLMVAVVGVAVGFQFHVLATSVTALTLVVLTLLGLLDRRRQAAGRAGARSRDSDQ